MIKINLLKLEIEINIYFIFSKEKMLNSVRKRKEKHTIDKEIQD